jgi:hypothetical protein
MVFMSLQEQRPEVELEAKAPMSLKFYTELHYLPEPHLRRQLVCMWHQEELLVLDLQRLEMQPSDYTPLLEQQMVLA